MPHGPGDQEHHVQRRTADRAEPIPDHPVEAPPSEAATPDSVVDPVGHSMHHSVPDSLSEEGPTSSPAIIDRALESIRDDLQDVERELARLLHSTLAIIPRVGGHLAFAGGKRFRPMIALLAAHAVGVETRTAITVAAVGELLHTATLLHDDVIDGADYRRGRPAARYQYGNGVAVLTGDYCLARALQAMADTGKLAAVRSMADTVTRMAEGEVAQLQVAGDWAMDRDRYYMVIDRKTAALIAWCSSVAQLVPEAQREPLASYGSQLGYAFQISDDIIDFSGDIATTGKRRGQDLREGKMTIPLLLACDRVSHLRDRLSQLLAAGPPFPESGIDEIIAEVEGCGALAAATELAREHARRAVESLTHLQPSKYRDALQAIALHLSARSN